MQFNIVAKTMMGLEEVLAEEIKLLGGKNITIGKRSVHYTGDQMLLYKSNLYLRTALRVLKPISSFNVHNEDELYRNAKNIDWSFIEDNQTFAVESTVNSGHFRHSKYAALLIKDAIVDQKREKKGIRPNVDISSPDYRIHLHINQEEASISLDSSGDSLHRRGYRARQNMAPLNEVLAAGLIITAGWMGRGIFTDPMCGSGTIPIEAAMIAKNIPCGYLRNEFGFMNWFDFDSNLWGDILKEAEENIIPNPDVKIIGSDFSSQYIDTSINNAKLAGVDNVTSFETANIQNFFPPSTDTSALTIMNPPYGERMSINDIQSFYKSIGDRLKEAYTNYDVWILSSNKDALKSVGLRTSRRLAFQNGPLEVKFHKYELYRGSKKAKAKAERD